MSATTTVPVTVTDEAAARIAAKGLGSAVDQMVERAAQTIDGVRRVAVVLDGPYDTHEEPYLTIGCYCDPTTASEGAVDQAESWRAWQVQSFPPTVYTETCLALYLDMCHER